MKLKKNQAVKTESEKNESKKIQILPLTNTVIFPKTIKGLTVSGGAETDRWIKDIIERGGGVGLLFRKETPTGKKPEGHFYKVGTFVKIAGDELDSEGNNVITVRGLYRFLVKEIIEKDGHMWADIERVDTDDSTKISSKLTRFIKQAMEDFEFFALNYLDNENVVFSEIKTNGDLGFLADFIMTNMADTDNLSDVKKMQETLETFNNLERFKLVFIHLKKQLEALEYLGKFEEMAEKEIERENMIYFMNKVDRLVKAENKKLGVNPVVQSSGASGAGGNKAGKDYALYEEKLKKLEKFMCKEAKEEAQRELARLAQMQKSSSEYSVAHTYLGWVTSLPWGVTTDDNLDLNLAQRIFDEDHYGLDYAKSTILEFLAVQRYGREKKLMGKKGNILLFVGPPGTGKTSLGTSIARAMSRKFIRFSLGGLRDESQIRGHSRTYVGALPGRIIKLIRRAGTRNPVIMLDEVDKIAQDFKGDPASALLEVLDPEQNKEFVDSYLDVPFDLSEVMFILTANEIGPIPEALFDRTERVKFFQYTIDEKVLIAKDFLVPKQLKETHLNTSEISFTDGALIKIIKNYTQESGVRSLAKQINRICRKVVTEIVMASGVSEIKAATACKEMTPDVVREYLGVEKFISDKKMKIDNPGIVHGLAWTRVGGVLLYIEATSSRGTGKVTQSGMLGEVMRQSITVATQYIKSNSYKFDIPKEFCEKKLDIHLHVPAGAINKDGPSAGVSMLTALISLMTGIKVSSDLAMSGEITTRGEVLSVGGVKEKVIGAYNEGIKKIILPAQNRRDIEADVPAKIQDEIEFHYVTKMDNVLEIALGVTIKKSKQKTICSLDVGEAKQ